MRFVRLLLLLPFASGCLNSTTVTRYEVRQSVWLPEPGTRAVGAIAPPGEWHIEGGYARTMVRRGPSRAAGGNGHAPTADSAHVRFARGIQFEEASAPLEASGFLQVGLSNRAGSSDMDVVPDKSGPLGAGLAARIRVPPNDSGALLLTFEVSGLLVPHVREVSIDSTTTSTVISPHDAPLESTTSFQASERTQGAVWAARAALGVHADFTPSPGVSLQPGVFLGSAPYAEGRIVVTETCVNYSCSGETPDDRAVLGHAEYVMPTFTATLPADPAAFVVTAWWLAASTQHIEESTPFGLSLSVRLRL